MIDVKYVAGPSALTPIKATVGSAGYNVYSTEKKIIPAFGRDVVSLGLNFEIQPEYYGKIFSHSSLIKNHFVTVGVGVIDSDFRGTVQVLLVNHSRNDFTVHIGQRIAQIVSHKCEDVNFIKSETLSRTIRDVSAFGSTGKF